MNWNPLDPSDPKNYVAYRIVTGDNSGGSGPPRAGGCGCLGLFLAAFFIGCALASLH